MRGKMGKKSNNQDQEYDAHVAQVAENSKNSFQLYQLVDMKGGGELLDLTREAIGTKDWRPLEDKIKSHDVKRFLYNDGYGMDISIERLVKMRIGGDQKRRERVEEEKSLSKKKGSNTVVPETTVKYRKVCWNLDQRGAVGETVLHLCMLNGTKLHNELAKQLVQVYPLLVNDVFHTDIYYGESSLHFAIVNEDFAMVKFLVEHGADVHERACGGFFLPDDQKKCRRDSYSQEAIIVDKKTNYKGHTYFGEYPLSFAACLEQENILRYLWSQGADVNKQDSNGNTALHMAILNDKKAQFIQCYELGASCDIKNHQGFTPLCLTAELANEEFYESIIHLERQVSWKYGDVTCALYPLADLDSIGDGGQVNEKSAFFTIVMQDDLEHLALMKGLVSKLLDEKWKTFARFQFYVRLGLFILYLILLTTAFYLRPGVDRKAEVMIVEDEFGNMTNVTVTNRCYLLYTDSPSDKCRLFFECMTVLGALMFLFFAARELHHLGKLYWNVLRSAPAKALFLMSCLFVILACFGRIYPYCFPYFEDVMIILCILTACPFFLFFLRVYALLGPFIFMIYRMIKGDLAKFLLLYLIFFIGFSQAIHIVFLSSSVDTNFIDSSVSMFVMSLGEFGDLYDKFDDTMYPHMAKFLFFVYMVLVTLLLVNMLIAMMGNTFSTIANADCEWQRQWAKVVLVLEQTMSPLARETAQQMYSQPVDDMPGTRAMVQQTENETHDERGVQKSRQRNSRHRKMVFFGGKWVPDPAADSSQDGPTGAESLADENDYSPSSSKTRLVEAMV